MKYSSAISPAVKGVIKAAHRELPPLHQCPRCKCFDEINMKHKHSWLKPFNGYVQTELCWVCIMELRRSQSRRK